MEPENTMSMTRQHFKAIASAMECVKSRLNDRSERYSMAQLTAMQEMHAAIAKEVALELRTFNRNFDRDRFLEACGVED